MFIIFKERNVCLLELHHRKQNRLQDYDYSQNGAYFITICTKKRHEILCNIVDSRDAGAQIQLTEYGKIVDEYIKMMRNDKHKITIDTYVIMPDHIHVVITIVGAGDLDSPFTRNHGNPGKTNNNDDITGTNYPEPLENKNNHGTSGSPSPTNAVIPRLISAFKRFTNKSAGFDMWQRSYHDHVIRNAEEYRAICQYIADNPARWLHR